MITIQLFLTIGFVILLGIFLLNPLNLKIRAWKKILGVLFVIVAIYFVLFPESANELANLVGVQRGADLLLYVLVLCFIFVTLNFYLNIREINNVQVKLARKLAILEANEMPHNKEIKSAFKKST